MFKKIVSFLTATALTIQCLCIGNLLPDNAVTASAEELSSTHIDTTATSNYITGIDVSISDTANNGEFVLNVNANPLGFEGYAPTDPILVFYHKLVNTYLSEYLVDGEMPDPETLTQEKLSEIMNKAKNAITSDPELSATEKFMSYTFYMPKKADVTNADNTEGTPADIFINCVSGKDIPYIGTSIRMGEYAIEDTGSQYKITISLDNSALWANPKAFNFIVGMNLNGAETDVEDVKLGSDGDVIEIDAYVEAPAPPEDKNTVAGNFNIQKSSSVNNDNGTVTYTITASALNGATLAGKTVTDLGPDNLTSFSLTSIKKDGNSISAINSGLSYTFPSDSTETEATFELTYKIKSGAIGNYIQNNGFYLGTHNKVNLTDSANPDINKASDTWNGLSSQFMNKGGQIDNSDSKQINWTITINTKYVCADNIYLVDYLNNIHEYIPDSLKVNGTSAGLSGTASVDSSLSTLVVNPDGTVSVDTNKVLVNGTDDEATEGFVIKLSDFGNPTDLTAGGVITVTYSTKLKSDIDAGELSAANGGYITYNNSSELIADNIYYGETTKAEATEYEGEIERNSSVSVNAVPFEKFTASYVSKSQIQTWTMNVNPKFDTPSDKAIIVDTLPDNLAFPEGAILTGIVYDKNGTSSTITFTRVDGTAPADASVEQYKYYVDGNKITIGLGAVATTEKVSVVLSTKVVDGELFANSNDWQGSIGITNTATVKTQNNGTWAEKSASATTWVGSHTFEKQATSNYDVDKGTVSWKLVVNANCLPIEGLKLTEVLPDGMTLESVDKIVIHDAEHIYDWGSPMDTPLATVTPSASDTSCTVTESGDTISWSVTETTGATYGGETVTFSFNGTGTSNNRYEIHLTTKATDEVKKSELGKGTNYYFTNEAELTGEIYDEPMDFTKQAQVNANYNRTDKSGSIVAGREDIIKWECTFNKDKVDMSDVWLVDDLEAVGLELILDNPLFSFTIKNGETPLSSAELAKFTPDLNLTNFSIMIPEDYKDKTLTITFYTRIVTDAETITNKLYIRQNGSEDRIEHSNSNAVDTDDYNYSAGASTSPNPKIIINKKDLVTGNMLPGVKFTASYTYMGRELTKTATSNESGIAYLTNLPKDTLITFTEEATADGYVIYPKKYKVVFLANTKIEDYDNDVHCIDTTTTTKPQFTTDINNRPIGTPAVPEEVILFKNFKDTDFGNMSTSEMQTILSNTEFTIYSDAECTTAVATESLSWDNQRKQAYVKFDSLTTADKYYYIKETKTAAGYNASDKIFKISVDEDGIVSYEADGSFISTYPVCVNEKSDIESIVAYKIYQDTDLSALSEAQRNSILYRTEFMLYKDAACTDAVFTNGIVPAWDSVSGKATLTISSGIEIGNTYYLKETKSPIIYKLCDTIVKITVNNDGTITYHENDAELTESPVFENTLKVIGPVTLEKTYEDTVLGTMTEADRNEILNGTVFTLYGNEELSMVIGTASPVWNGNKAVVTFTDSLAPDYTYYLKETSAPDGYVKSENIYKCIIDEDGTVTYYNGNEAIGSIVCVNDKEEATETTPVPETTPAPETTTEPEETPAPDTTTEPEETPAPDTTTEPEETPAPETTTEPEETPAPDTTTEPEETPAPDTTTEPEETPAPETTTEPEETPAPETTTEPEETPAPETTTEPEETPAPDTTTEPEETPAPDTTTEPEETPAPDTTTEPEETPAPETTTTNSDLTGGDSMTDDGSSPDNPNTGSRLVGSAAIVALLSAGIICIASKRKEN